MLIPPDLAPDRIVRCLEAAYNLAVAEVAFLPLGADADTAVYRVTACDGVAYFLKLRRGAMPESAVAVPRWLAQTGMREMIPPIACSTGALWTQLDCFTAVLYPFVTGRSGWNVVLSPDQWREFGAALRKLHDAGIPAAIAQSIPREDFASRWRDRVMYDLHGFRECAFTDPIAEALAEFIRIKDDVIRHIVDRAAQTAVLLSREAPEFVLCHGDVHAGNLLIDESDRIHLVDWDTLIYAPKERDLMFIGGGIGGVWNDATESACFYSGYGDTTISTTGLIFYRYERIVQDIAEICEYVLTNTGDEDRAAMLEELVKMFEPGNVVEIAGATDGGPAFTSGGSGRWLPGSPQ